MPQMRQDLKNNELRINAQSMGGGVIFLSADDIENSTHIKNLEDGREKIKLKSGSIVIVDSIDLD